MADSTDELREAFSAAMGNVVKRWVMMCFEAKGFVEAYDRLHGTNVAGKGPALALMIDQATGHRDDEFRGFIEFCLDMLESAPQEGVDWLIARAVDDAVGS